MNRDDWLDRAIMIVVAILAIAAWAFTCTL